MPERLAYDEAMLLSSARLRIADPELKHGKVELLSTPSSLGPIERPWGIEGGFAVVYKFRTPSGRTRALRCFRVAIRPDMRFRYERIGPFFQRHVRDLTADFHYYDEAIVVKDRGHAARAYPVIDMEWIDGLTLLETVARLCRRADRSALQRLAQQWLVTFGRMRRSGMAHGDLAAVNIMVRPDGRLALVDYDGVYIPDFAPERAALPKLLLGQPDYQHPGVLERRFDVFMDDFSALVIYTALLALADEPERWQRYAKLDAQGHVLDSNLLFTVHDFRDPQSSPLFHELEHCAEHLAASTSESDAMVTQRLAEAACLLHQGCLLPVNDVRFPDEWLASAASDAPAVPLDDVQTLFDPEIEPASSVIEQRTQASSFLHTSAVDAFLRACAENDDIAIAAAYEEIANFNHYGNELFTPDQIERAQLAMQRRSALARFRMALSLRRPLQIAEAFDDQLLTATHCITPREQQLLTLARQFASAYTDGDTAALRPVYETMQQGTYRRAFLFSAQEQQRIQQLLSQSDAGTSR